MAPHAPPADAVADHHDSTSFGRYMLGFCRSLLRRPVARTAPTNRRTRLAVEAMEERAVPAAIPEFGPNGGRYEQVGPIVKVGLLGVSDDNPTVVDFPTDVVPGTKYLAVASGGGFVTDTNPKVVADAEYIRFDDPSIGPQNLSSVQTGQADVGLRVNGLVSDASPSSPFWGEFQSDNVYVQRMQATATRLSLYYAYAAGEYGNNSEYLYFRLFKEGPRPLAVTASATPATAGQRVEFRGLPSGGTGSGYQLTWTFGDGATASGLTVSHTYSNPGTTYTATVRATDSGGNTVQQTVQVQVAWPLVADGKVNGVVNGQVVGFDSAVLASGNGAPFSVGVSGGRGAYTYTWEFGDGSPQEYVQSVWHTFPPVPEGGSPRTYTVHVAAYDADGRRATDSIPITVYPPLRVTAAVLPGGGYTTDATINPGQAVTLQAWGAGGDGSYEPVTWDFGDGTTGTGNPVTHVYAAPGLYRATARLSDGSTAEATATVRVTATDEVRVTATGGASEAGTSDGYFTVFRRGTVGDLLVNLTYGGTAVRGTDYNADSAYTPLQVTIPNGRNYAYVPIFAYPDNLVEGTENVQVRLAPGTGYRATTNPIQAEANLTIADNPPRVWVEDVADIDEGASGTLVVRRSGGDTTVAMPVSLTVGGSPGLPGATATADYQLFLPDGTPVPLVNGRAEFVIPAFATTAALTITARTDGVYEGDEWLRATVADRSAGTPGYVPGESTTGTTRGVFVNVKVVDGVSVIITDKDGNEIATNPGPTDEKTLRVAKWEKAFRDGAVLDVDRI
jgi:hypothetical protein